jgi:hypothetical protein
MKAIRASGSIISSKTPTIIPATAAAFMALFWDVWVFGDSIEIVESGFCVTVTRLEIDVLELTEALEVDDGVESDADNVIFERGNLRDDNAATGSDALENFEQRENRIVLTSTHLYKVVKGCILVC